MTGRTSAHLSFVVAMLAATSGLSFATQAQAQDLHLQPGTDCSRLLATEQTACHRQMRRLELRQMEEQGTVVIVPGRGGIGIPSGGTPSISTTPFRIFPHSGGIRVGTGASGGMSGK